MSEWLANLAVGASIMATGLGILLAFVASLSARRMGAGRLWWVSVAFVVLAVQGGYLTVLSYAKRSDIAQGMAGEFPVLALLSVATAVALYLAVLKR